MSQELLSSKVVVVEEQPRVRSIQGVQTSIAAFVGVTERGPLGEATLLTSFDEYRAVFGGYTTDSDVATAVSSFFEEGGNFCYVIRTVHYTDPSNPNSKTSVKAGTTLQTAAAGATAGVVLGTNTEPFNFEGNNQLDIDVDGAGTENVVFTATSASRTSGNAETFALSNGETLTVDIDGTGVQTVEFLTGEFVDISNATAQEVANVINAKLTGAYSLDSGGNVVIASDTLGTDSSVDVTGGSANAALGFTTGIISGTGDVGDITAVTVAEIKAHVEAGVSGSSGVTVTDVGGAVQIASNTTGPSSTIQVLASSSADTILGIDNAVHSGTSGTPVDTLDVDGKTDGAYANSLSVEVTAATSGVSTEFNLYVLEDGVIVENFPNLTMVDGEARYVESIVNADSNLIEVTDLDAGVANQRPANATTPLTGGDDGLVGLTDADFIGDSTGETGIKALDNVQNVNILCVPGQSTAAIYTAMINYCETTRDMSMFPILDPPADQSYSEIVTFFNSAGLAGLSEFGAFYWPRVKVVNPAPAVFGDVANINVNPSGLLAGLYARVDGSRPGGVYIPPAGIENGQLRSAVGLETDDVLDEAKRDFVAPNRINIITTYPGAPIFVDGSYVLKGNGNFPFISQRRGAIFIEQSIKQGIEFARHQNNNAKLRREVERTVRGFLLVQMNNGAFSTTDPSTAFFVAFNDALNPPSEVSAGRLNGRVGLAFNTPAVWIIVRFSKDTRALEAELQQS